MTNDQRTPAPVTSLERGGLKQDAEDAQQAVAREARIDEREQHLRELERQAAEEERQVAVAIGRSLNKHDR